MECGGFFYAQNLRLAKEHWYVTSNKACIGTISQKFTAEKTAYQNHGERHRSRLRHQSHDLLLSFKDIYDLVEWACLEDAKRALDEKKTCDTWQQGLLQIFEAVQQNKPFILNVYRCVHREQVEKYLQPLVDHLLLDIIQEKSGGMTVRDEDKQFIAQIYSYIFIGLMLDWIKEDMREDPQNIVDRLAKLITGSISAALARFQL